MSAEVAGPARPRDGDGGDGMRSVRQKVRTADGFTVSVQASEGHYCSPRIDYAQSYSAVEVGYPSARPEPWSAWGKYAEDGASPTATVYGWVPAALVLALIESHGGMTGGELPPLDPDGVA